MQDRQDPCWSVSLGNAVFRFLTNVFLSWKAGVEELGPTRSK
jgi:hypothetical protein